MRGSQWQISLGGAQSAAVSEEGELYQWGYNGDKQHLLPRLIQGPLIGKRVLQVAVGGFHTLCTALGENLDGTATVYAWGKAFEDCPFGE